MTFVAVDVGRGLVVVHSREQWQAFMRGVDREVCDAMAAPLEESKSKEDR